MVATPAAAEAPPAGSQPRFFLQFGGASETRALVVGAMWRWKWERAFESGRLTGYWEASVGRWRSEAAQGPGADWVTQLSATPVLRWHPAASPKVFLEGGIGANILTPMYRTRSKHFSSEFNFGDHIAVGRAFGANGEYELSLRLEHFSNGGIHRPNPGANFVQLRWAAQW